MALENLKLETWFSSDEALVVVRLRHDVPNGSAIVPEGASLAEALINLGDRLRQGKGQTNDGVWEKTQVKGEIR